MRDEELPECQGSPKDRHHHPRPPAPTRRPFQTHPHHRDLFYTDVKLFVDQAESDGVLDDVATMIGCTRSNLHVVASDKGLVVGRISFFEDGDFIDCTKMGVRKSGISLITWACFCLLVYSQWKLLGRREGDTTVH